MADKKHTVLDLFCGCGGISEGYKLAGYDIIGGIDFNKDATNTFKHNFKDAIVHCDDISKITEETILKEYGGVDMIVGGPPCQGFSSANRHQKENEDPRNKLFFEYLRFVKTLMPKAIMIENVRGILTRDNGYAKERINTLLEEMGYIVNMNVLCAANYGVPQNRNRAVIIGIRKDICQEKFDYSNIVELPKVTVQEAIGDLYQFENAGQGPKELKDKPLNEYAKYLRRPDGIVIDQDIVYPAPKVQERISYVKQGENWQSVPKNLWPNERNNRHSSAYKRLKEDDQSCTIDTGNAHSNYFHPLYNRIPTIRESARLQSFSDSFEFTGPRGSRYKQIGNAVPPLLAKAVALAVKKILDNDEDN